MKKTTLIVAAALAATPLSALADFEAEFVELHGLGTVHIDNTGSGGVVNQDFAAGQLEFAYTNSVTDGGQRGNGQFSGGTFRTFCIELQNVQNGANVYDVDSIQNDPNPSPGAGGPAYDAADEAEVHAVVAAAIRLGWINEDLSANSATDIQLAAIQGQIWKVVLDNSVVTGNFSVGTQMGILETEAASDPTATVGLLRAMLNADSQDQLYIVPLPTAAFAGLITLGGLAGMKRIRRK